MLATTRQLATKKFKCLIEYCKTNYVRLQITKCAVMCINGNNEDDLQAITVEEITLKQTTCEIYLGSAITNSTKLSTDVNTDIKNRQLSIVKYYAFLRNNRNAPVDIKLKVLEASTSAILYNSETWANTKIDRLEVIYSRMLRSIIGIGTMTCNEIIYIEWGVLAIKTRVKIRQFEFWKNKVIPMSEEENPMKYIIEEGKRVKLKEITYYKDLCESYTSKEHIKFFY